MRRCVPFKRWGANLTLAVLPLLAAGGFQPLRAQEEEVKQLTAVPSVDLSKYAGVWYEIARLPNRFQEECACNVTATYTLLDDGEISVVNRCITFDGDTAEAEGRARPAGADEPPSKLKVRFAPAFLSFLPFVWGDYWIIDLAPDYSYAAIGEPERRYFWILARTPALEDATLEQILANAERQGYDLKALRRTKQLTGQ